MTFPSFQLIQVSQMTVKLWDVHYLDDETCRKIHKCLLHLNTAKFIWNVRYEELAYTDKPSLTSLALSFKVTLLKAQTKPLFSGREQDSVMFEIGFL